MKRSSVARTALWYADTSLWARTLPLRSLHAVLVLLIGLSLFGSPRYADAAGTSRVLPQLQQEAAAQPRKTFRLIVTRLEKGRGGDEYVAAAGGKKLKDLPHDAFVAELPGRAVQELGRHPHVKFVAPDARMRYTGTVDSSRLGTLYPAAINAAGLWSATTAPVTGAGVGVAVLDTGLQTAAPDWNSAAGGSRIAVQARFNSNTNSMNDGHGHGTHVFGIIAGNSWFRTDATQGKYVGVAPEARLVNVKVSDDAGTSYISDVVTAVDWVVNNRQTYNIRVMNLSLVSSVAESYKTSTLAAAVERAWFSGIAVIVAAGNAGPDTMQYPPANDPFVITVGAADAMGTPARGDDGIAPWSSYGTTQDGFSKPEVVAPGRSIVAPLASGAATLAKQLPDRIVDGNYLRLSGTSMAAPVVAGVAALAFQAHPEWSNDQFKWLLQNTSTVLGGSTRLPGQGAGLVDAAAIVRYGSARGIANQGIAISEQLIGPNGETNYTTGTSSTWSTSTWSTSTWSTSTWSTSTWSTSTWSTSTQWAGIDVE